MIVSFTMRPNGKRRQVVKAEQGHWHSAQHESVDAGRIFAQLQDAGMKTVQLDEIVWQRDPELKQSTEGWAVFGPGITGCCPTNLANRRSGIGRSRCG
jgi:hypothetical protein